MAGRKVKKGITADWDELLPKKGKPKRELNPYNEEQAQYVLTQMSVYGRSLLSICQDEEAPPRESFYRWMRDNPVLSAQYARAREDLGDHAADEIAELARTVTPESASADRVKLDALKWRAERLKARSYSPTARVEATGKDGGPILTEQVKTIDATALDADARDALKQALLAVKNQAD